MSGAETQARNGSGGRWDALAHAAAAVDPTDAAGPDLLRELLAFEVGDTCYAVSIERVREILRMRPITPVPRVPEVVRGVVSIRGEVVEVLDLRRRLGLPPLETDRRTRIVVVHGQDGRVTGLIVDRVREVLRVVEEAVLPAPDAEHVAALCRKDDGFVSMLDLDRVLTVA